MTRRGGPKRGESGQQADDQDLTRRTPGVHPKAEFAGQKGRRVAARQHMFIGPELKANLPLEHDSELFVPMRHRVLAAPPPRTEGDEEWIKAALGSRPAEGLEFGIRP